MLQRKTVLTISLLLLLLLPATGALQAQDNTLVIAVGIEPVSMDSWRRLRRNRRTGLPQRR